MKKIFSIIITLLFLSACASGNAEKKSETEKRVELPSVVTVAGNEIVLDGTQSVASLQNLTPDLAILETGLVDEKNNTVSFELKYTDGTSVVFISTSVPWNGGKEVSAEYNLASKEGIIDNISLDFSKYPVAKGFAQYNGVDVTEIDKEVLGQWFTLEATDFTQSTTLTFTSENMFLLVKYDKNLDKILSITFIG